MSRACRSPPSISSSCHRNPTLQVKAWLCCDSLLFFLFELSYFYLETEAPWRISVLVVLSCMLFVPLEMIDWLIVLAITKAREQDVPVEIKQASELSGSCCCTAFWTNEAAVSGEIGVCTSPTMDFFLYDCWMVLKSEILEKYFAQKLIFSVALKRWTVICYTTWTQTQQLHLAIYLSAGIGKIAKTKQQNEPHATS